jgi:NADH-quinone oxidoreductase subunit J
MNLTIVILLMELLVLSAIFTVMIRNLLKAAIALALTSAVLTVIMFLLGAWMAAVFELSVCAGLITVVIISAISLTKPLTMDESREMQKKRLRRFIYLPFLLIVVFSALYISWKFGYLHFTWNFINPYQVSQQPTIGDAIWKTRQVDIIGQIIVILSGVFGVVVLFKEKKDK